jgi:4-amino-4-deoxy-L-arabinose transferase-like glycosyltransferase
LLDALTDLSRRETTCLAVLAAYVAVWAVYAAIAKSSQDIHYDMGEMIALSRETLIGTPKHPPLGAWLVGLWFKVFPLADWAYYLFALVIAAIGLWCSWKISERYLDPTKRAVGLALLTLTPFFNFHALKFNANTILIPLWAATTWTFLRSFETRSLRWAALAGLLAAASMLGKYWTIFLLLALALATLADPRRGAYFRSAAPWVTVAAGSVALAPHVAWLVANDFPPLHYGVTSHEVGTYAEALKSVFIYIPAVLGYVAVPIVLVLGAARLSPATLGDVLWPREPDRRTAVLVLTLGILLPAAFTVAAKSAIVALWSMAGMTLLPVVLLSSPRIVISEIAATRILALAAAFPWRWCWPRRSSPC